MSIVSKFIINEKTIDIADTTARTSATSANTLATNAKETATAALNASNTNKQDILALKELSRLTVSYEDSTQTITFANANHAS